MMNDMKELKVKKLLNKSVALMCMFIIGISSFLPLYATDITTGTSTGTVFKTSVTYAFTDDQLRRIASMCYAENGSSEDAIRAEASLMANLYERSGNGGPGNTAGFIEYIQRKPGSPEYGWFSTYYIYSQTPTINTGDSYFNAVKDVLVNGNRYFPPYVDEHDWLGDIISVSNNGQSFDPYDRSQYIKDVTVIKNNSGATYTFYCFPDSQSDPFGYISKNTNSDISYTETGSSGTTSSSTTTVSPYQLTISIDEEKRTYQISYELYDEEKIAKVKEKFEKAGYLDVYNQLLEEDKKEGIKETDKNGRLAIIACLIDNGLVVKEIIKENMEYIPKFIKAELTSMYPDLREVKEQNQKINFEDMIISEFQGTVKFKRRYVENMTDQNYQEEFIEYINKEEFDEMITDVDEDVLNYFTMDEQCTYAIVANERITNGEISYSTQNVNYKNAVSKFAMPFALLESFLLVGQDFKLSDEMIRLAYEGKIEIALMEQITVQETMQKINYYSTTVSVGDMFQTLIGQSQAAIVNNINFGEPYASEESLVSTVTTKTYKIVVDVVDTWICTMKQMYKPIYTETLGEYGTETFSQVAITADEENQLFIYSKEGYQTKTNTYTVTWEEDGEKETHLKIKDDEGNFEGLLALLATKTLILKEYKYKIAISNIYTGDKWIFEMLEDSGQSTAQVNLIKYMFYEFFKVYYGVEEDYGVTEPPSFDELFGSLDISNGTTTNSTQGAWEQFLEYQHAMEGAGIQTYNINGEECYTVLSDGSATGSAVGYGVDIGVHGAELRGLGYDTSLGAYIPVKVVDEIEMREHKANYDKIVGATSGLNLKQYQIFALTSRAYNMGYSGAMNSCNHSYEKAIQYNFVDSYKMYWSAQKTESYYNGSVNYNEQLYTEYMCVTAYSGGQYLEGLKLRRESEWLLFSTGHYKWYNYIDEPFSEGTVGTTGTSGSIGSIGSTGTSAGSGWWWPIGPKTANNFNTSPQLTAITSGRGYSSSHQGIDINGNSQYGVYDVIASAPGIVVQAEDGYGVGYLGSTEGGGGYGNHVVIEHTGSDGRKTYTYYGHMNKGSIAVKTGQTVLRGQQLGKVGSSGNSSGPHLHFEVREGARSPRDSVTRNPLNYVSASNPYPQ